MGCKRFKIRADVEIKIYRLMPEGGERYMGGVMIRKVSDGYLVCATTCTQLVCAVLKDRNEVVDYLVEGLPRGGYAYLVNGKVQLHRAYVISDVVKALAGP
jgi:hypothetical protein